MKILVAGRSGQLARSLLERLDNVDLCHVGRPEVDLEVPGSLAEAIRRWRPDVVVNAAAYTAVDQAESEEDLAFRINAEAAAEAAAASAEIDAAIIYPSTDYVFDGNETRAYREDDPPSPASAYGRSKLAGEEAVRASNPRHLILRTAWVYSPFGRNFVRTMLAAAQQRDVLNVVADQRGNPTSALDLADGIAAALPALAGRSDESVWGTYHLAGTGSASWYEFAVAIMEEARSLGLPAADINPISTADWPTPARRPMNSMLDSQCFARTFGFTMPSWRSSLRHVVQRLVQEDASLQAGSHDPVPRP